MDDLCVLTVLTFRMVISLHFDIFFHIQDVDFEEIDSQDVESVASTQTLAQSSMIGHFSTI